MKKQAATNARTRRVARKTRTATKAKPVPAAAEPSVVAERSTKTNMVIALLQREGGATISELREATGWQAHSVRGFISGTLRKKQGLVITLVERENSERAYHLDA